MIKFLPCAGVCASLFLVSGLRGAVFHVSPSGNPLASGVDWQFPTTLQHALARAQTGDEIWLMQGTYYPDDEPDPDTYFDLPSGVALYGGFAGSESERDERDHEMYPTILSGDYGEDDECPPVTTGPPSVTIVGPNANRVVRCSGESDVVLDGLTIRGAGAFGGIEASASSLALRSLTIICNVSLRSGGGICATDCSVVFDDVTFARNRAMDVNSNGGGAALHECDTVEIRNCRFHHNQTTLEGGGLYAVNPGDLLVATSAFKGNISNDGGGLAVRGGSVKVSGCEFSNHQVGEGGGGAFASGCDLFRVEHSCFLRNDADRGGGCRADDCADIQFDWVRFVGNESTEGGGGGLFVAGNAPLLTNVEFTRNIGDEDSGGLALERAEGTTIVIGGIFTGNDPGAIYSQLSGPLVLNNVTVTNNKGRPGPDGGTVVVEAGDIDLLNTIVWETASGEVEVHGGTLTSNHSNVGEFDPMFVNSVLAEPGADNTWGTADDVLPDLRLQAGSGSIDAGIAYALMPEVDMQGLRRMLGTAIDQGAFEFTTNPRTFDRDGDGVPDVGEFLTGTSIFDPGSFFALQFENATSPAPQGTVSWRTVAGRRYTIECSPDLENWSTTGEFYATETGTLLSVSKPIGNRLFFRGRVTMKGIGIGAQ